MSALCRHRGHALAEQCTGSTKKFVCPYHRWTYAIDGNLVGAPRMKDAIEIRRLREESQLPLLRTEIWYGFIFVNFDANAAPLAPTMRKLERYMEGYDLDSMVTLPPSFSKEPVRWNWKMLLENYIEPYHTEYVHPIIHDFAPSTGVEFDPWRGDNDNVIVRYMPFLAPDGGLTEKGWAAPACFPPIETLSPTQRHRVGFGMVPPSMNIIFTPDMLCYGLIYPLGPTSLTVGGGLFTFGGWCMPKSTVNLPDFADRAGRMMEGSQQLGEQDTTVNLTMQRAKVSRFAPRGRLAPLEETLSQFNRWLAMRYRDEAARRGYNVKRSADAKLAAS
jgi:phenylpropionate dioxygenase-like ring-hydroxylating dioxygenase large terminal subunit